jgi:hypothetical protein
MVKPQGGNISGSGVIVDHICCCCMLIVVPLSFVEEECQKYKLLGMKNNCCFIIFSVFGTCECELYVFIASCTHRSQSCHHQLKHISIDFGHLATFWKRHYVARKVIRGGLRLS